ncbi:RNA binding protein-like protein Ligatin/Tma64 [Xylona heveae TC161]|uniref:RNA binding protein-like protein Ligatin/Tma64 n=1 Tax=Xylona heveae (strain CBS 132557 / TC161) TaxID=1328760 RepID=A0A165F9J0_XYLHT|nr:RNA binding protein-like protein Ligatin/Tma64 [Xylona heveae TC161]KZF20737.1 RNA binding protein-like protein Ligatin/Tma64 [Xylona heveae TC161]
MFKKKPNIKPFSPLRSSERRRVADQIIADFKLEIPASQDKPESEQSTPAPTVSTLRNALLPDNTMSARFTTTAGPNLKQVSGTVYAGTHDGEDNRILWIKVEDRMYPTVYTLWRNPNIVPLLHTPSFVLEKLQGGADLMTPGLTRGPPFPTNATKGAVVAIASHENPTVPLAVGVCEIDVSSLQKARGEKGKAVHPVQWEGDEIWAWNPDGKAGRAAPNSLDGWAVTGADDSDLEEELGELSISDEEEGAGTHGQGVSLGGEQESAEERGPAGEEESAMQDEKPFDEVEVEDKELTTREIDDAFRKAFLYGLYHHKTTNKEPPHHGLVFPLTQSFVIANLVLPYLPAYTPAQASSLQIKKTSWKNVKKFIKTLDKELLVKSKDRSGGEIVIMDVDFDDQALLNFVPYRLPKKEAPSAGADRAGAAARTAASSDPGRDDSIGQKLTKVNLYKPKDKFAPLFEASGSSVKAAYVASEIRIIVTAYIESENLIASTNKRLVNLNPILANAVFDGQSPMDREVLAKGAVPRDALVERVLQGCANYWAILRGNESMDQVKPKSGAAPKVQIVLETRSGNKTVTKVSGVEAFYIKPNPLADELRTACAGSTSVGQLVGSSPKHPVMEIMVQGPQKDAVIKALEKRGISRQWVEIVDKTKGKKR